MSKEPDKKMYSIGGASKLCNVSTKTLRYYDKIGVVVPDYVSKENGYRYYSDITLLKIPVIKYYKQMGFKLEEILGLLNGESYHGMEDNFRKKILELNEIERQAHNSYVSVNDWYELIKEAKAVGKLPEHQVSVRYLPTQEYVYLDQEFSYDYRDSIINIAWTDYLDSVHCSITGAVFIEYPSLYEKMNGNCCSCRIMQRVIGSSDESANKIVTGGQIVASVYHVGGYESIHESYQKILDFAHEKGYICGENAIERYVLDYWVSEVTDEFVTEIIVPVQKKNA